jgi:3'(2'), 5'-bisphosphate nucleotidase
MPYERERQVALEAALSAAKLCEDLRQEMGAEAIEKKDGTPVTVADFGAQALICRTITNAFAADQIVAEEDGTPLAAPSMTGTLEKVTTYVQRTFFDATQRDVMTWINRGNGDVGPRYWAIDPIDGTKGFLRGDHYAVAVALIEEGEVKLGILACPSLPIIPGDDAGEKGVLFAAMRGQGASMFPINSASDSPIRVATLDQNPDLPLVESVESTHCDHAMQHAVAKLAGIRVPPMRVDGQPKYGIVARGEALLYLRFPSAKGASYLEKIWDHAAGSIIVEEAGGRVTDMQGEPLDFSRGPDMVRNQGIIAGHVSIHDKVLEVLRLRSC